MSLLYISILWVCACVDSAESLVTVSAQVGSTVILPCKVPEEFKPTSFIKWQIDRKDLVFERSSNISRSGSGYEGRVDVPLDELRKGNCSLVLKNVRFTDDQTYYSFTMVHVDNTEAKEITRVNLSVYALQISAPVGSTVVLPCDWGHLSIKTPDVVWLIDSETVFERKGKDSYEGEGYEGRVDVPEDELLKGNCSLEMKNISVNDTGIYSSSMIKDTQEPVLVQKVKLSVVDHSVHEGGSSLEDSDSHQTGGNNWIIICVVIVIIIIIIIGVFVYCCCVKGLRCARNSTEQNENVHRDTELHDIRARTDLDSVTYTPVATQPQS
ncbi:uncharacterized protein LOC125145766 [Tachysurus fulvidraco]|uniref:uncharacterized protein LOC125145766 n=1 Tax=Tachysurus fulvidraco TaxID=1234273 RepID=UPI001FEEDCB8|nr:uncharacterized protein LOC125145766 [Tachysurus fulvidraco]XP_047675912.1 uncharacterized protein LOC125145766 [Tachysurus fulvidraco]